MASKGDSLMVPAQIGRAYSEGVPLARWIAREVITKLLGTSVIQTGVSKQVIEDWATPIVEAALHSANPPVDNVLVNPPRSLSRWLAQAAIATVSDRWREHPEEDLTSSAIENILAQAFERVLGDKNKVIQALIDTLPRSSREQAMLLTKLEEAQMWLEKPARDAWRKEQLDG